MQNPKIDFNGCKMTLLSEEQVFGRNKLNYFKKYSNDCSATDFAIALGCLAYSNEFVGDEQTLKNRKCEWNLSSSYRLKKNNFDNKYVYSLFGNKEYWYHARNMHQTGIRPILPLNKIEYLNGFKRKKIYHGYKFFEYPQDVVDQKLSLILEKMFIENTLRKTGKHYTTDAAIKDDEPFTPVQNDEYYYKGEKYVRIKAKRDATLSNGQEIKRGDYVWFKVSPISWPIDVKAKLAICEKVIASGVRFCNIGEYTMPFEETELYMFLNTYLIKELYPSVVEKTPEECIEEILSEIKKYQKYYLGVVDIEGEISKLISDYNANLKNISENENPLSLVCKDSNTLYQELVTNLNYLLEKAQVCEKDIKPYYDMVDILNACYGDSTNFESNDIYQDINKIRTVILPFIVDDKIREKLTNNLDSIIAKTIKSNKTEIFKYKKTKVPDGKSLNDLKIEFRKVLGAYLAKLSEAVVKQDLVSEIMEATKIMIENHFTMSKNERVKSLLNNFNTAVIYVKENGNESDLELLNKYMNDISNVKLNLNLNEIIKYICDILIELYKLQFKIEERVQKKQKINNLMVHTDISSFFSRKEKPMTKSKTTS